MPLKQICIALSILLFSFSLKAQQQDGSVFERRVSINAENQPLSSILDQISWQVRVYFSYDATQINASQKYTVQSIEKSLYSVLTELFNPQKFQLHELENQIIITKKNSTKDSVLSVVNDSIPVKYFFLTGSVLEQKKEVPVAYASVSVLNEPVGTITNTDGDFLLKLHPDYIQDTLVISSMGYKQILKPAYQFLDEDIFLLEPISIRIREVKVVSTDPEKLLDNISENIKKNYSAYPKLMSAFYRETVKQDNDYINVSEAVMEILKAPYVNTYRADLVRLVKARQSPDVQPFKWINFKLQGGPFTITQLDVIKTVESFLAEETRHFYDYQISNVIRYNNHPVFVLEFKPVSGTDFHGYVGELYVHRETFAVVHARFGFDRRGLRNATSILIKRKPIGVKARPSFVEYEVNYMQYQGKWHLSNARASTKFKIRSRKDNINSEFHSVSELLITDLQPTELKRFPRKESLTQRDVFVEMINDYDPGFWENYNIIKPDEDLRNAIPMLTSETN
jgi:hypothetical protein